MFFSLDPGFYFQTKQIQFILVHQQSFFLSQILPKLLLRTVVQNNLFLDLSGQDIFI
jgi:hypothetical protein